MAASRRGKKSDEKPAETIRFAPLDGSGWEDSGYLPPDDDQSWREMEALRIGAYDRVGHLPPRDNQSWREQEVQHLAEETAEAAEPDNSDNSDNSDEAVDTGNANTGDADAVDDPIADLAKPDSFPAVDPVPEAAMDAIPEPAKPDSYVPVSYVPVREPLAASASRGGGGVMLLLVAVVGLVTLALAVPGILTPDFWRAQWAAVAGKPAATPDRLASIPAPAAPAVRPPPQSAPVSAPALNSAPPATSEPTASAEPQAATEPPATTEPTADATPDATPSPRPQTREDRTMVIGQDGAVKYEGAAAGSKRAQSGRAAVPDDAGGFYAMAPGPDGILRRQFFASNPQPGSEQAARAPSRDADYGKGVYAMAPGPDGKLTYQYFPPTPPR